MPQGQGKYLFHGTAEMDIGGSGTYPKMCFTALCGHQEMASAIQSTVETNACGHVKWLIIRSLISKKASQHLDPPLAFNLTQIAFPCPLPPFVLISLSPSLAPSLPRSWKPCADWTEWAMPAVKQRMRGQRAIKNLWPLREGWVRLKDCCYGHEVQHLISNNVDLELRSWANWGLPAAYEGWEEDGERL